MFSFKAYLLTLLTNIKELNKWRCTLFPEGQTCKYINSILKHIYNEDLGEVTQIRIREENIPRRRKINTKENITSIVSKNSRELNSFLLG